MNLSEFEQKKIGKNKYLVFAILLIIGLCMFSGCRKKDFSEMPLEKVEKLAEMGNVRAQVELGKMIFEEIDAPSAFIISADEIKFWFAKAAAKGDPEAKFYLGLCDSLSSPLILEEFILDENLMSLARFAGDEAIRWWTEAAEDGYGPAQMCLGERAYALEDFDEAVRWLKPAGKSGLSEAMYYLGWCYFEGRGTKMSYKDAYNLWETAASDGHTDSLELMGQFDFERLIRLEKEADEGDTDAQLELAEYFGSGKSRNSYLKEYWNNKASMQE